MDRIRFIPSKQKTFIERVYTKSGFSTKQLAALAGIHARSFIDWRREKLTMTLNAAEIFCKTFAIDLPEEKAILIDRWKRSRSISSKKGAVARFNKYGTFATKEGRIKGGKISWQRRKENPKIWRKYANVITKPKESVELAEFLGIMLGDGGITKYQCSIYLSSETDQEYAKHVKVLLSNLFNLNSVVYKHKKDKVLRVSVSSADLVEYLTSHGLVIGNKILLHAEVPKWIWSKPEYIKACIRGLIDTDGCFVIHRYRVKEKNYSYPKIAFANGSVRILDFVLEGFKQLGFNPKIYNGKRIWLLNQLEVKRYLKEIGTRNYKPSVIKILEGDSDGYENGLLNRDPL